MFRIRTMKIALGVLASCIIVSAARADGPPVRAGTSTQQQLRAPQSQESFDFVIFGDHKGGPVESIEILREAVSMANILDPDFVMTVGDLVNGYNEKPDWIPEMEEFKEAMDVLSMPWYPVAGNHDVYDKTFSEEGNIDLYQKHFGPLYYSFDYKWAHFVVLFSDESMAYSNPAKTQNFSEAQLDWLRMDLASSQAKMLFIFMHHPRWTGYYNGCNWPKVHEMLVKDGRPTTVVGGHIHYYRFDGKKDNVTYYAMSTTGGHQMGQIKPVASVHHVNLVRVRPDRVSMACLPVGSIRAGDYIYGWEVDEMWGVLDRNRIAIDGDVQFGIKGDLKSELSLVLENPTSQELKYDVGSLVPDGWECEIDSTSFVLKPKEKRAIKLQVRSGVIGQKEPSVRIWAKTAYTIHSGLVQPLEVYIGLPLQMTGSTEAGKSDPQKNGVLSLDGASAVRVDMPSLDKGAAFTLECWVRGEKPAGKITLLSKAFGAGFGILWCDDEYNLPLPSGHVGTDGGYKSLKIKAKQPWDWSDWTHVALVYENGKGCLFVDGRKVSEKTTQSPFAPSSLPLFVGAGPSWDGKPCNYFKGQVDEVRLSSVARYGEEFQPERALTTDSNTLLLLHFDQDHGIVFPSETDSRLLGWAVGKPIIVTDAIEGASKN